MIARRLACTAINHKVFDAEARVALLDPQAALNNSRTDHFTNISICLDNLEVVQ